MVPFRKIGVEGKLPMLLVGSRKTIGLLVGPHKFADAYTAGGNNDERVPIIWRCRESMLSRFLVQSYQSFGRDISLKFGQDSGYPLDSTI